MPTARMLRCCDPVMVQSIWNHVEYSTIQKQSTAVERIVKAVAKTHNISDIEAKRRLDQAEDDRLLERFDWVNKSNKVGESNFCYRVPDFTKEIVKGSHDWYCFACHKPGEVLQCADCYRVYHKQCLEHPASSESCVVFSCSICKTNPKCVYKRKQIRKLLEFATHRLRSKPLWKDLARIGYLDEVGRNDLLLYKYLDLTILYRKIKDGRYRSLDSFLFDVQSLVHDVCVIYGDLSNMADLSRVLLREVEAEVKEIRLCTNCYINAKAKPSDWVSKPCQPPHKLIWAKLRGFPFWPAKILAERNDGYEVRFFGAYHERGFVAKDVTRPFDIPADELGVRQNAAYARAFSEVDKLQELVSQGYYTSSSGESDMPATDNEWTDQQYINDSLRPANKKLQRTFSNASTGGNSMATTSATSLSNSELVSTTAAPSNKRRRSSMNNGGANFMGVAASSVNNEDGKASKNEKCKRENSKRPRRALPLAQEGDGLAVDDGSAPKSSFAMRRDRAKSSASKKSQATKSASRRRSSFNINRASSDLSSTDASDSCSEEDVTSSVQLGLHTPDSCLVSSSVEQLARLSSIRMTDKSIQVVIGIPTPSGPPPPQPCDCKEKFSKMKDEAILLARKERDALEQRLRNEVAELSKSAAVKLQEALERQERELRAEFQKELNDVMQQHREAIAHTKRRQWCYNCLEEAMYHCCWNTSYCSIKCQQEHWHKEHKKVCRRKR